MATKLYPTNASAADLSADADFALSLTPGSGFASDAQSTVTGPATLQFSSLAAHSWWFEVAAVTISGTITFNFWGDESNMGANAGFRCVVDRCDSTGAFISNIATSNFGTELAVTTSAVNNWTATPTSTTMADGDYLRVRVYATDVGTMGSGFVVHFRYSQDVANSADSWVQFTETIVAGTPATFLASKPLIIGQAVQRASTR